MDEKKVQVEMLEGTVYEGVFYKRGEKYELPEEVAQALGTSIKVLSEPTKKEVKRAPKNKMIGDAPETK